MALFYQNSRPQLALRTLKGGALARHFASAMRKGHLSGMAASPTEALARIETAFGVRPTRSGSNIQALQDLRRAIALDEHSVSAGLMITAPHTHWSANRPILISKLGDAYYLRESLPCDKEYYWPVSFIFSPNGAQAYEWVDSTVPINTLEIEKVWRCVARLAGECKWQRMPFGVSVNYRFKRILEDAPVPTSEFQSDGGAAVVFRSAQANSSTNTEPTIQVAWHASWEGDYNLNPDELAALSTIRAALDKIDDEKALGRVSDELTSHLATLTQ